MTLEEKLLDAGCEDALIYTSPSYDDAAIGTTYDGRVVYDYELMIESLIKSQNWSREDAIEWIDYNTLCAHMGGARARCTF